MNTGLVGGSPVIKMQSVKRIGGTVLSAGVGWLASESDASMMCFHRLSTAIVS